MNIEPPDERWPDLLRRLRHKRRVSMRILADNAGVSHSMVHRAENGQDCLLSTWVKLFAGLGYLILTDYTESSEEAEDLLAEEAERRKERQLEGLAAAKWRFFR